MKLKYSDMTLEQCYNVGLIYECICDADSKSINANIKEEYNKTFDTLKEMFDSLADTFVSICNHITPVLKDLLKTPYKRVKKGKRYILKRIK